MALGAGEEAAAAAGLGVRENGGHSLSVWRIGGSLFKREGWGELRSGGGFGNGEGGWG